MAVTVASGTARAMASPITPYPQPEVEELPLGRRLGLAEQHRRRVVEVAAAEHPGAADQVELVAPDLAREPLALVRRPTGRR